MNISRAGWSKGGKALAALLRTLALLAPTIFLTLATGREEGEAAVWLAVGAGIQLLLAGVQAWLARTAAPSLGQITVASYLVALVWLSYVLRHALHDWLVHLAQAVLIVVPVALVSINTLLHSSFRVLQQARRLARRLQDRRDWPENLSACRDLPEVKALRDAIQLDASPALHLLREARAEVRISALAALEFRKYWRAGQAETVLAMLQREAVPEARAAAINALANVDDRSTLEVLAGFLRDPDPRVRKTAAIALFWNAERRWNWIRFGVRRAMAEPSLREDGPLLPDGHKLAPEAAKDLTAWAAEKGILGLRAAQTLAVHYARLLHEQPAEALAVLNPAVLDPHTPPLARIEFARMLRNHRALESSLAESLLDAANPAPLRLLAAETLLAAGPNVRAVATLREIARLPNREIALCTADVVQRCLGVDLSLPVGKSLPPLNSARAIEITRRLMAWAARPDYAENVLEAADAGPVSRYSHADLEMSVDISL